MKPEFIKKIIFHSGSTPGNRAGSVEKDWAITLVCSAIVFIGLIFWGVGVFSGVSREEIYGQQERKQAVIGTIDRDLLDEIVVYYGSREKHFLEVRAETASDPDPSL